MTEKQKTLFRITERMAELSNEPVSNYTIASEVYRIVYADLVEQLGMVDLSELAREGRRV